MKLNQFIAQLQTLQECGHGDKQVLYRHGASGDCGLLCSAYVTNGVDEWYPFDLEDGENYISIYAGN